MKKIIRLIIIIVLLGLLLFILIKNKDIFKRIKKIPVKDNKIIEKKEYTGLFKDYYEKAEKIVDNMTIKEKVGQLFLVRYDKNDTEYLSNFYPGGYILFARDFQNHTKEDMKEELENLQNNNKYPLIIGVDEEGGFVTRVSRYKEFRQEKFKSPREYYDEGGYELLEKTEKEKANLLKSIGINLNLAPVADISTDESDFINNRAFGYGVEETSEFIKNMVNYSINNKINSTLKHFPGYGSNKDTHTGIAIDEREYQTFVDNDYKPFESGIKAGVPSILVSHNIVKCIDEKYPSSLSKSVIKELREKLNFTGIIMTDDLAMDAVKSYVEEKSAATLAINAGNDMIITSDFITMKNEVLNSIEDNKIKEETINKAVTRIIAWKLYSNLEIKMKE